MKDLVQIIRDNPGCVATIDNDNWRLESSQGTLLARAMDEPFKWPKGADFGSCCYGGDILQALAIIVGITVESV